MEQEPKHILEQQAMESAEVERVLNTWQEQFQSAGLVLDHNKEYFIVRSDQDPEGKTRYIPKWDFIPLSEGKRISIDDALKKCLDDPWFTHTEEA